MFAQPWPLADEIWCLSSTKWRELYVLKTRVPGIETSPIIVFLTFQLYLGQFFPLLWWTEIGEGARQIIHHLSWIFPSIPRLKSLSVFLRGGVGRLCKGILQLDPNLFRLQSLFGKTCQRKEDLWCLRIIEVQLNSAKDKYQAHISDKFRILQIRIPKKSKDPTCNCSLDRWLGKLELCGSDMTGVE